ncbi:hypothetical protein [Bradyrhizobium sp. HKCCYLS20291]|uniref:hypothetical protein n=1 Tax=Bradyrhizobium sp. HKCCYLS20291 TaxID=3420766 RepID=UPI003EC0534C
MSVVEQMTEVAAGAVEKGKKLAAEHQQLRGRIVALQQFCVSLRERGQRRYRGGIEMPSHSDPLAVADQFEAVMIDRDAGPGHSPSRRGCDLTERIFG